jgi:hypothetical protein
MENADPMTLRWSDVVSRSCPLNPGVPLTIWCDEDTPLIWPEVSAGRLGPCRRHRAGRHRRTAGRDHVARRAGADAHLCRRTHPNPSILQRRRVVSAFLDKFALPDRVEMEFDMPGWTEMVAAMTAAYHDDIQRIRAMPGVTFIAA